MNTTLDLSEAHEALVELDADISMRYSIDGFKETDHLLFDTVVVMEPSLVFSIGVPNDMTVTMGLSRALPTHIGSARITLPCWKGPGTIFGIAYSQNVSAPGDGGSIRLHVDGRGDINVGPPHGGLFALVEIEGFDAHEFPITVGLRHGIMDFAFDSTVIAYANGTLEAWSEQTTFPLIALHIEPGAFIGNALEVCAVSYDAAIPDPGPAQRRIRVILTQAVIDPPL